MTNRIGISTGGGDAPGLNAVIRAAVISCLNRGWECLGIRDGYSGLLTPDKYQDGGLIRLDRESVRGITHLGGSILGTNNRDNPKYFRMSDAQGNLIKVDRTDEVVANASSKGLDALIAIGGDGSMALAHTLCQKGLKIVGVPKTIDNDLDGTVVTFGFDSAVSFATQCLDRLHSTAEAHKRIMVVEVMGRYAGWIALHSGLAGTADVIFIPEIQYDIQKAAVKIQERYESGRQFAIVVVAEGARAKDGSYKMIQSKPGGKERLGGIGAIVAEGLQNLTGLETRVVVLGHLLRGGTPTSYDRLISLRFGAAAVRALEEGRSDCMVALDPPTVRYVNLQEATRRMKGVPLDGDTILTARDLGVSFGD